MLQLKNYASTPPQVYVQYPGFLTPAEVYGGTWKSVLDTEGAFFRAAGGEASAFGAGLQLDQMQRLTGQLQPGSMWFTENSGYNTGAFAMVNAGSAGARNGDKTASNVARFNFDSGNSPNARVSSTTSGETRPRNHTIRIWARVN